MGVEVKSGTRQSPAPEQARMSTQSRDGGAEGSDDGLSLLANIRNLYYFATFRERVMLVIACLFYLSVGGLNASMNIIIGEGLKPQPEDAGRLAPTGLRLFQFMATFGAATALSMGAACYMTLVPKHRQMARWKISYLKAIVRQEVGWYDVNRPQELAARIGEAVVSMEKAHSIAVYRALIP